MRVAVRCQWSGARLSLPPSSSAVDAGTTLAGVVAALVAAGFLPGSILGEDGGSGGSTYDGATLVHARTAVPRGRWSSTTLGDLVAEDTSAGGGILLVLSLGNAGGGGGAAAAPASSSSAPAPAETAADPMDVDQPLQEEDRKEEDQEEEEEEAAVVVSPLLSRLLSSNYDADLRPCLRTLLKMLDNIISQPGRSEYRTIRLGNRAFAGKVGRCRGAVDLLVDGCGFERRISGNSSSGIGGIGGGSTSTCTGEPDLLVLPPPDEDQDQDQNQTAQMVRLVSARHLLAAAAVRDLGMDAAADLPPYQGPPPQRGGGGSSSASNRDASTPFDPYQARRTATGAAAAAASAGSGGAGNSTGDASTLSRTEKELRALQAKRERLEKRLQKLGPGGRAVQAYRPGSTGTGNGGTIPATSSGNGGGSSHNSASASSSRGDGSLLASRMKRLEEERKKREDGGFTTRAMRDLESIKKAKVYTHAALRIGFADGCYVTARFLPSETVGAVRAVLKEECFREDGGRGLDLNLDFDLYVAPPRRKLDRRGPVETGDDLRHRFFHRSGFWKDEKSLFG